MEQSSVVWSSYITKGQEYDLERVHKVALRVILDYADALESTGLKTLKERRRDLSLTFAQKFTRKEATQSMFPLNPAQVNIRKRETFKVTKARNSRLARPAIPAMQRQLNQCK